MQKIKEFENCISAIDSLIGRKVYICEERMIKHYENDTSYDHLGPIRTQHAVIDRVYYSVVENVVRYHNLESILSEYKKGNVFLSKNDADACCMTKNTNQSKKRC